MGRTKRFWTTYLLSSSEFLMKQADKRIACANDRTILAITEVVMRCNKIRQQKGEK